MSHYMGMKTWRDGRGRYLAVHWPDNPLANTKGAVYVHRDVYRRHKGEIPEGFHVHHVDGDKYNNDPDNLECLSPAEHRGVHNSEGRLRCDFVCPSCGAVEYDDTGDRKFCSRECHYKSRPNKIDWPEPKELRKMAASMSMVSLGRKLGVSDNAVRKRLKMLL